MSYGALHYGDGVECVRHRMHLKILRIVSKNERVVVNREHCQQQPMNTKKKKNANKEHEW